MSFRTLGHSGLQVSTLTLGTMSFGDAGSGAPVGSVVDIQVTDRGLRVHTWMGGGPGAGRGERAGAGGVRAGGPRHTDRPLVRAPHPPGVKARAAG